MNKDLYQKCKECVMDSHVHSANFMHSVGPYFEDDAVIIVDVCDCGATRTSRINHKALYSEKGEWEWNI